MNATAPTTATPTPYQPITAILERIAATDVNGDLVQYISFMADHALINSAKLALSLVRAEIRYREEDGNLSIGEEYQPIFSVLQYIADTDPFEVGQYSFVVDAEIIHAADITLALVRRAIDEINLIQEAAQRLYDGPLDAADFIDLQSKCVQYKSLTGMPISLKRADGTVATLGGV